MSAIGINLNSESKGTKADQAYHIKSIVNGVKFLEIESPESRCETVKRHNQEREKLMSIFS